RLLGGPPRSARGHTLLARTAPRRPGVAVPAARHLDRARRAGCPRRAPGRPGAQRLGGGGLAPARRRRRADVRRLPVPAVPRGVRAVLPPRAADRRPPLLEPENPLNAVGPGVSRGQ